MIDVLGVKVLVKHRVTTQRRKVCEVRLVGPGTFLGLIEERGDGTDVFIPQPGREHLGVWLKHGSLQDLVAAHLERVA